MVLYETTNVNNDEEQCNSSLLVSEIKGNSTSEAHEIMQDFSLPQNENEDLQSFAQQYRSALGLKNQQHLMIAVAWVLKEEIQYFKMFPDVLQIDVTEDTDKERRPLLVVTIRTTTNRTIPVLHAFLPNQKAWSFRWVFSVVMPRLFGEDVLKNVKFILTDGDRQETSQVDVAIQLFFPHANRLRCGWHIVDQGWVNNCKGLNASKDARNIK